MKKRERRVSKEKSDGNPDRLIDEKREFGFIDLRRGRIDETIISV